MKRLGILTALTILAACAPEGSGWRASHRGYSSVPAGYYSTVDTSSAAALRATLHAVIDDHQRYPYTSTATDTWDILESADEDPNDQGQILDVYKNAVYVKLGGGTGPYNREHTWPKSYGFPNDNMGNYPYTDCHQLFLADSGYNSSRNNKPYGECDGSCLEKPTDFNDGRGGGTGVYPGNSDWVAGLGATGTWQTWSGRKGDVARALLYLDVRYEGGVHGVTGKSEPDLILTDDTGLIDASNTGSNEAVAYMGRLSTLIAWHKADPPDLIEQRRNDVVHGYQGNRNPFVDHPEWVDCVFNNICEGGSTDLPPAVSTASPADGATVSGSVTIELSASDGEDAAGTLDVRVSIDGGVYQPASYNAGSGRYELTWDTTAVADGSHTIDARATDSAAQTTQAGQVAVTVDNVQEPPPPPPGKVHVGDLDGASQQLGKSWKANVTVTLHDAAEGPVSAATVSGTWSDGSTGSCTTDATGTCVVSSAKLNTKVASTSFAVSGVSHATLTYDVAANHDPESDSDGTTITVSKDAAPPPPPPPPPPAGDVHVGDLDGAGNKAKGKYWQATVTVTVHDSGDSPAAGVTVSGAFSGGVSGSASCTTDSSGTCTVRSDTAAATQSTISFTVAGLSGSYDGAANHDPDGDSDGTTIAVSAP